MKSIAKEHINDNQIRNYDSILDAEFGEPGTLERVVAEEQAYVFCFGQIPEKLCEKKGRRLNLQATNGGEEGVKIN